MDTPEFYAVGVREANPHADPMRFTKTFRSADDARALRDGLNADEVDGRLNWQAYACTNLDNPTPQTAPSGAIVHQLFRMDGDGTEYLGVYSTPEKAMAFAERHHLGLIESKRVWGFRGGHRPLTWNANPHTQPEGTLHEAHGLLDYESITYSTQPTEVDR